MPRAFSQSFEDIVFGEPSSFGAPPRAVERREPGRDRVKKRLGEGLFSSVVFGQRASTPTSSPWWGDEPARRPIRRATRRADGRPSFVDVIFGEEISRIAKVSGPKIVGVDEDKAYTLLVAGEPAGNGPDAVGALEERAWSFLSGGAPALIRAGDFEGEVVESYLNRAGSWSFEGVEVLENAWLLGVLWPPEAFAALQRGEVVIELPEEVPA